MRLRRDAGGRGAFLEWRVRLMGAGAIVALVGIWADADWLVNAAIVLLFVGFLLRFVGTPGLDPHLDGDDGEDQDEEAWDEASEATGPEESEDGARP